MNRTGKFHHNEQYFSFFENPIEKNIDWYIVAESLVATDMRISVAEKFIFAIALGKKTERMSALIPVDLQSALEHQAVP